MRHTRAFTAALAALLATACGTGDPTGFDGLNTMGSGTAASPIKAGPSLDGGNYFGSGNRFSEAQLPTDSTDTAGTTESDSTTTERGPNTIGSGG